MLDKGTIYPNLSWQQFAVFNDNATGAFEDMCRDLFHCEYLKGTRNPHSDHNNPGVEVLPILEPVRDDGEPQKFISFQAKYFEQMISDGQIVKSLKKAVEYYKGQLGRLYLFCNKVISKDSERFRKYQSVLSPASIELELVTDKDIFTLIRKHKHIVDYYFQDRRRTVAGINSLVGIPLISSSVSEAEQREERSLINPLLQELIRDRVQKCKEAILNLNFGKLKSELKVLVDAIEVDSKIAFYQFILAVHDHEKLDDLIYNIPENYKEEAYWIKNLCNNPRDIFIEEIRGFSPETQIVSWICVFSEKRWDNIVALIKYRSVIAPEAEKAFDFHYALALLNLRKEDEAHIVLSELYRKYHETRFKLYDICSQLNRANRTYVYGKTKQEQLVKSLLNELDRVKEQSKDQLWGDKSFVATIELQICFNLGATDKSYIEDAVSRYEGYPENVRKLDGVRLFMALCYEMGGNLEEACELLSQCAWRDEEGIASRYFMLLIELNEPEKVIDSFREIKTKTPRIESVLLLALSKTKNKEYESLLIKAVNNHSESIEDLFLYGFSVENQEIFNKVIMPKLNELLKDNNKLQNVNYRTRVGLLTTLAHNGAIKSIETILDSIQDIEIINLFVAYDIYNCLYLVANHEYDLWRKDEKTDYDMTYIERIANRFYENDVLKQQFLQIKVLCAAVSHMEYSMLRFSKELFEYTHDVQTARNIIALLYKRNETHKEEYEPYIEVLKESEDPQVIISVSSALWKLGKYDEADFYVYKAIYNLNGRDDFDVYKGVLEYHYLSLQRLAQLPERKAISDNMIVTLKSGEEIWIVALDSESEFYDKNNHSLGAEHINRQDQIYNKLLGSGRRQVINIRGKRYEVIDFEPREITIGRFIFQKIAENPDKFKVCTISSENPEELVKQLLVMSDRGEHIKKLTDSYNFKDNHLGIPIDFFNNGSYEKYIATMQYLLYTKGLAYYAGEPRIDCVVESRYIPSLSTFVLLALHDWLDELDLLSDYITIPESYVEFFREQYASELGSQKVSVGSFVPLDDGGYTIIKRDKRIPEIWERIISKCDSFTITTVTDDERINFEVIDNYTWERLFGKTNIDKMQLDGLIVAERENGVYICDDLFFRKIAAVKKIKNINFATLLYINDDFDEVMPIIMQLSKTNYVYTPIRSRNNGELQQLLENLFDGEMKKAYYSDVFSAYINRWNQVMRETLRENSRNVTDKDT